MYKKLGASQALVHGFKKGATKEVEQVASIEDMANADKNLKKFTLNKLREFANSDKPFYLQHAFMKTHADNHPAKEFEGASSSKYAFKDSLVEIDAYVGEILEILEETGQLENTFILFMSDNDPQMHSWPDSGYTPFRGAKGTGWEGAIRVPGIISWKGMIEPGQISDGIFDFMDVFNTSLALAGVSNKIPTKRYIDGIDQTPFLLTKNGKSMRDKVFVWSQNDFLALRKFEYKLHFKVIQTEQTHLEIDMATTQNEGLSPWLFNLYIDPKEQYPVGHRRNAWLASMGAEAKAHGATFRKVSTERSRTLSETLGTTHSRRTTDRML